jgi:hypothetical protein
VLRLDIAAFASRHEQHPDHGRAPLDIDGGQQLVE